MQPLGHVEQMVRDEASSTPVVSADNIATRPDLDDELRALQKDASEHHVAHRRTNDQLCRDLVKAYWWWRKASKEQGYLESLYEKKGIRYRNDGGQPNFNPLLRLVFNIEDVGPTERVTLSQWNKALQAIHARYLEKKQEFSHNPEGKLAAFIQSSGGVSGLAESAKFASADEPDADVETFSKQSRSNKATDQRITAEVSRHALKEVETSKAIGTLTVTEPIRVGRDNLSVLLARRVANGPLAILGSSNDPNQIDAVAASITARNATNLPTSLRALVEIIATQAFPLHALPSSPEQRAKWYLTKYADQGDLYESDLDGWEFDERGRRLTSSKRLLLRGENHEALFSGGIVSVSPVTRCILKEPLIEEAHAVYLRPIERVLVEQWYHSGELALLRVEPENRLESAASADEKWTYKLTVKNAITEATKFLHFYDHNPDKVNHYQADFRKEAFEPSWQSQLSSQWFGTLREGWTDKWFAELGRYNQITRKHNEVLRLKITPDKFELIFNRHADTSPSEESPSEAFELPAQIPELIEPETTAYLSKDLAPILLNLADAPATSPVTMAGNKHALVFTYETAVGQFEIAVPTFDEASKKRDGTLFYAIDRQHD